MATTVLFILVGCFVLIVVIIGYYERLVIPQLKAIKKPEDKSLMAAWEKLIEQDIDSTRDIHDLSHSHALLKEFGSKFKNAVKNEEYIVTSDYLWALYNQQLKKFSEPGETYYLPFKNIVTPKFLRHGS